MRVVVTGSAGFIGHHVSKKLLERGDVVLGVDDLNDYYDVSLKEKRLQELEGKNFSFEKLDVSSHDSFKKIVEEFKPDIICHLAAQAGVRYSIENPFVYEQKNGLGTLSVLEVCRGLKVPLVYASSSSVYGTNDVPFSEDDRTDSPVSLYAATKKYNELMAYTYYHLYGINCTGLRFFTVYGPWGRPDMAPYKFVEKILRGETIDVFNNGDHERDFTYVDDISNGVLLALDNPQDCEVINLGRGSPIKLMDFIKAIEDACGVSAKKNYLPAQPGDVHKTYADITKARRLLGYDPKTDLVDGIREFVTWYKKHQQ